MISHQDPPPDIHISPQLSPLLRNLCVANAESPTFHTQLSEALHVPGINQEVAAARIVNDALTAIGFGALTYADRGDSRLISEIANLHILRANGNEPDCDLWGLYYRAARDRVEYRMNQPLTTTAELAVRAMQAAAAAALGGGHPDGALSIVIHAWDIQVPDQHDAVIFWASNMVLTHIRNSGEVPNAGPDF